MWLTFELKCHSHFEDWFPGFSHYYVVFLTILVFHMPHVLK